MRLFLFCSVCGQSFQEAHNWFNYDSTKCDDCKRKVVRKQVKVKKR
jgi:DNA-directed RNA polymerase subunit RPC12/RpoP